MIDSENSGDEVNDLTPRANDVTSRANDATPRASDVTPNVTDDVVPQSSDMNDGISTPNEEKLAKNTDEAQDEAVGLRERVKNICNFIRLKLIKVYSYFSTSFNFAVYNSQSIDNSQSM